MCVVSKILDKNAKNGIKQHGYYDASGITARIFTRGEISAGIGDPVRFDDGDFDRAGDLRITEIYDNRRGVTPHYKIVCGK